MVPSSLRRCSVIIIRTVLYTVTLIVASFCEARGEFDPYQLNGGLVSAVAGRDYVVVASDTRLTNGGYEILSRQHLGSRLWTAARSKNDDCFIHADGSVDITRINNDVESSAVQQNMMGGMTLIGSAGCAADCEELKRRIRMEMNSHLHWQGDATLSPTSVATLLGQTLYSRRSFPYYSFCVLAGLESHDDDAVGVVHVYDAVGSHERVAVASAGSGKEMLQPILDRLFSSSSSTDFENDNVRRLLLRDHGAIDASAQRVGLKLNPPVQTHVECDVETAISHLVKAYQAVSEREASVGDDVVVCVLKLRKNTPISTDDNIVCMEVSRFPLRKD